MWWIKWTPAQSTSRIIKECIEKWIPLYTKSKQFIETAKRAYPKLCIKEYSLEEIKKSEWPFWIFRIDDLTVDEFLDLNEHLEEANKDVIFNCYNPLLSFDFIK